MALYRLLGIAHVIFIENRKTGKLNNISVKHSPITCIWKEYQLLTVYRSYSSFIGILDAWWWLAENKGVLFVCLLSYIWHIYLEMSIIICSFFPTSYNWTWYLFLMSFVLVFSMMFNKYSVNENWGNGFNVTTIDWSKRNNNNNNKHTVGTIPKSNRKNLVEQLKTQKQIDTLTHI